MYAIKYGSFSWDSSDNSCSNVMSVIYDTGVNSSVFTPYYCSADPLPAHGGVVYFYNIYGGNDISWTIDVVDTTPVPVAPTSVDMVPFSMDLNSAGQIGGALLLVMAVAYVFRLIRNSLGIERDHHDQE